MIKGPAQLEKSRMQESALLYVQVRNLSTMDLVLTHVQRILKMMELVNVLVLIILVQQDTKTMVLMSVYNQQKIVRKIILITVLEIVLKLVLQVSKTMVWIFVF